MLRTSVPLIGALDLITKLSTLERAKEDRPSMRLSSVLLLTILASSVLADETPKKPRIVSGPEMLLMRATSHRLGPQFTLDVTERIERYAEPVTSTIHGTVETDTGYMPWRTLKIDCTANCKSAVHYEEDLGPDLPIGLLLFPDLDA